MSKWIKIEDRKPEDGQTVLAKFKHGIIECHYDAETNTGQTYIWQSIEFCIYEWIPIEIFTKWVDNKERGE